MKTTFAKSFVRDLKKLKDRKVRAAVEATIANVESARDPLAIDELQKLTTGGNHYRIRVGHHRIGVTIDGDIVNFIRCLPRREIYRFFP